MLNRAVSGLPAKVVEILAETASDVRAAFKSGDIESTMSTRTLVKWAKVLQERSTVLLDRPEEEMKFALQFVLTDLLKPEDAKAIEGTLYRRTAGLVLSQASQPVPSATDAQADSSTVCASQDQVVLDFLVNGLDSTKAVSYWAGVKPAPGQTGSVINGTIYPDLGSRMTNDKDADWFDKQLLAKIRAGYADHVAILVDPSDARSVALSAARLVELALKKIWNTPNPGVIVSDSPKAVELALKVGEKLQINDVDFCLIKHP
jgi:hypothetical protein